MKKENFLKTQLKEFGKNLLIKTEVHLSRIPVAAKRDHRQESINLISHTFSTMVRENFTGKEFREVLQKNQSKEYKYFCPTHDYCSANELMLLAFEKAMRREFLFTDADFDLINEAWKLSRENSFTTNE